MNPPNLTNKQLSELDSLFELVSQRQKKDFGNINASNKADGSLLTSCDLWSDKTIVDGLASIAPGEGVLSEDCLLYTSDAADDRSRGLGDVYKRQMDHY